MKKINFLLILILLAGVFLNSCLKEDEPNSRLKMWYDKPATIWNEALPLGNGRLGAMVYGDPVNEKIQLNEETLWSGSPSRNDNPKALKALPQIRQLIFNGKYHDAEKMINENIRAEHLHGSTYQTIGNLLLSFNGHETYTNYYRELDLEKALSTTTYEVDGVFYKQEVFATQPDQVVVVKLSANKKGKLNFTAELNGPLQKISQAIDGNTLEMSGISDTHEGIKGKVKFNTRAKLINKGGKTLIVDNKIKVSNADEVVILISMATNFVNYKTLTDNQIEKCVQYLENAESKSYKKLYSNHIEAFQKYFNRVSFDLGTTEAAKQPTDVRIKNFANNNDPELISMYYQFGRYLLISSSQPGGQPANLQGIWNESTRPAWDSKYTININTEMNYWPAEKCNLSEMHEPLLKMVKELSETGRKTAKDMYGCDGWVAHHNTDIWRISGLVDGAFWGMWPMGGAWLSQHLWERYLYTGDLNVLEEAYPIFKSACEFYQDFLIEEPVNNWLVVSPSISPENAPIGRPSVCAGTTMDNQLLFDLFSKTIKTGAILNRDKELMDEFQQILDRLPPMQIGQHGQLQEWMEDLDNPNDKHRHVSHLYGLYPSSQISPYTTPELFDAARTSLIQRGDVSTGWSMGWKVNFWARLLDGNHALKLINDQLTLVTPESGRGGGGTYPNFFDAHPPFQIDGNFGCTSGITEMLLQTYDGAINILPALPDSWKEKGEITGLCAYGGFEISISWENSEVQKVIVKSKNGGNCRIRLPNEMKFKNGSTLMIAHGKNPNLLFAITNVKTPLISANANLNNVKIDSSIVYDLPTKAGISYELVH